MLDPHPINPRNAVDNPDTPSTLLPQGIEPNQPPPSFINPSPSRGGGGRPPSGGGGGGVALRCKEAGRLARPGFAGQPSPPRPRRGRPGPPHARPRPGGGVARGLHPHFFPLKKPHHLPIHGIPRAIHTQSAAVHAHHTTSHQRLSRYALCNGHAFMARMRAIRKTPVPSIVMHSTP